MLIALNKPYGILSQFTEADGHPGLGNLLQVPGVYPAGRLDHDSEGLLLLCDNGGIIARISDPKHTLPKIYLAQVEGAPSDEQVSPLYRGLTLKDGPTLPAPCSLISEPAWLWPRHPPVRYRAHIPTSWLRIELREGRNRQVRRMCAAIGFPCLRLIRYAVGSLTLDGLEPGSWRETSVDEQQALIGQSARRAAPRR